MKFKKVICMAAAVLFATVIPKQQIQASDLDLSAESAILIEAETGQIIYEKNPDEILRPASITKIMTLLLIYDALAQNAVSLDDVVTVSEYAASMGGSQVFLEAGETQTVETMIKCIAIASANDACVAMAEYISGSESAFVEQMNARAAGLGMTNTTFVNCCGLDVDGHVTTARDVALMSRELITKYPEIHDISTIWMDTITHVTRRGEEEFVLTNTNKLLKQYEWATGLKTGSTSLAKFCLSATADRNGIELISVVMASESGKTRVSDSITLLNYGYGICRLYTDPLKTAPDPVPIKNAVVSTLECRYASSFSHLFLKEYDETLITREYEYLDNIAAPVAEGDVIGQLLFFYDGEAIGSVDILSAETLEKAKYSDYLSSLWKELISRKTA